MHELMFQLSSRCKRNERAHSLYIIYIPVGGAFLERVMAQISANTKSIAIAMDIASIVINELTTCVTVQTQRRFIANY